MPRWSRPLAVATAAIFCASAAFPVVAGLSNNIGAFPKWWGIADVVLAFVLAAMVFAVMVAANGKINRQAEDATYRAYRILSHGILAMLIVFFLAGERITWINCLTGFGWCAKAEMGKFSPDGRWVAYVSNDSGRDEVYVVPFPGPGARVQVSTGGGSQPRWRSDGRELVYLSLETKMRAAEVAMSDGNFRVGAVQTLFLLSGLKGVPGYLYDMTADGQRFIAVQDLEHTSTIPLTVMVNWDAELRKK